jgi:hypothetical protein
VSARSAYADAPRREANTMAPETVIDLDTRVRTVPLIE